MKKRFYLVTGLGLALGLSAAAQQDDAVRRALRGTSPSTTLGSGIGQVVQPVGKPLIRNPNVPQPPLQTTPETEVKKEPLVEEEKGPLDPEKVKGKYTLEGLPEKEEKGKKASKRKTLPGQTLSAQTGASGNYYVGGTPSRRNAARVEKAGTPKPMRIPYGEKPKVQTVR